MFHFVIVGTGNFIRNEDLVHVFGTSSHQTEHLEFIETDDLAIMAVKAGIFPSKNQAKKNGLRGPAPSGLHWIGTKKKRFWVWNPHPSSRKVMLRPTFSHSARYFPTKLHNKG